MKRLFNFFTKRKRLEEAYQLGFKHGHEGVGDGAPKEYTAEFVSQYECGFIDGRRS